MSNRKEAKLLVLTGILALGIFAAAYSSTQMLNAAAQTNSTQTPVTSADDIDCETDPSLVHCAEGQSASQPDEAKLISAPYYHGYGGTSTISTSGFASTKVKPDMFSVTAGVETNGTTAQEAASRNADLMAELISALKALGISEDQISTSSYSVYPVYEFMYPVTACPAIYPPPPECQPKNVITGYRASNSVTVTLEVGGDVGAGEVIDTAVQAGANNVNGVYFFVSQQSQQAIRDGLIAEAIANARHRAEIAAEAVGMQITGVQSINLNDAYFPVYGRGFDAAVGEAAPTPIMPGEQEISSSVHVVFVMGNGTSAEETGGFGLTEPARAFLESKLPELGIEIDNEMDIHMDMISHISENEYHVDFAVVDVNEQVHSGHIEVVDGEVTVAVLDGESIL